MRYCWPTRKIAKIQKFCALDEVLEGAADSASRITASDALSTPGVTGLARLTRDRRMRSQTLLSARVTGIHGTHVAIVAEDIAVL